MTLCAYGSTVKSGSPPFSWITWIDAQSWLGSAFAKFSWLSYLIHPVLVQVSTFCATEPVQPVYPGDSVVAAAATDPQAFDTVIQFIKDSATWWAWSQLCICNANPTPTCAAKIWALSSTPAVFGPTSDFAAYFQGSVSSSGYTLYGLDIWTDTAETLTIFWNDLINHVDLFQSVTLAVGWNTFYFTTPLSGTGLNSFQCGARDPVSTDVRRLGWSTTHTHTVSAPLSLTGWYEAAWNFGGPVLLAGDLAINPIVCTTPPAPYAPAAPAVPTTSLPDVPVSACTTTADLCTLINPMVDQVALLKQRLDLIQRRLLPFAWIAGATSSGLTGTGSIAVQDCLGCIVSLTTVPGGWGSTVETPRRLIPSAGSVQGSDGTRYDDNRQLHYEHQVILFGDPWATSIRWNFKLGITASITPIFPEP